MPHTFACNFVHIIFSTKNRTDSIPDAKRDELFAYIGGIARNLNFGLVATGGTSNHVHLLLALPPTMTISEAVQKLKANSSRWAKESISDFTWQDGYGAFSVSPSQVPVVKKYISNQQEHHRKRDFREEFSELLRRCGISFEPERVFD